MRTTIGICLSILLGIVAPHICAQTDKDFTIVIDPGHGGKDAGCIGKILKEKDLNLSIALRVGELIEANCPHVKVIYTRKSDLFITLMERTEKANKAKADLFLSIHADAIPRTRKDVEQIRGAGVFTMGTARTQENLDVAMRENRAILLEDNYKTRYEGFDPGKPESYIIFEMMQNTYQTQSLEFARSIQNSLVNRGKRHNRDVRQAGFYVLRTAAMPSILVETGFISNTQEEKWLASKKGKETIANAIYMGFVDYKKSWDRRNCATPAPQNAPAENASASHATPNSASPQKPAGTKPAAAATATGVTYKIQFLSSPRQLKKGDAQLKGLWPVDYYKDGNLYRYTYGSASDKSALQNQIIQVRKKFQDAFVVTFDAKGNRIK